ncbi:DUF3349 domain-containing protein [Gordonia sp. Z-3]|jgi:hypothetical protein|uniref:DUF3349 domain-containing protein n=2 Tax=Gordonia TaxID=2053 RepID=A0A9X3I5T7_9ACTN|nr:MULTISPECIES: DUF3349 domain-containing protein [Gordonia]MCF3940174.1 DUF3349 domain-containing protein [Gordonia tangerina]MCX2965370.1 DUF3349 domain-containing protein [Gordonia aquimaris]MED5803121.1 DUF3349 domain-containing protein [Gordonia sp. Z-3]
MSDGTSLFESAINWVRQGYPEGIPPTEFPPLLALLVRVLDERQVTDVVLELGRDRDGDPLTEDRIAAAITSVIDEKPSEAEINQVASRLAAAGWPLAATSDR